MESRPKRTTRNPMPSYKFEKEDDFFRRNLTEKMKREILTLIKRDLGKPSTAADVGSAKHLAKLGREIRVVPNQLREWLGITDGLTQVNTSSLSSKEKGMVREASRKEVFDKLGKQLESMKRKFDNFRESDQKFQRDNQLSEDLEEEFQDATEEVTPVEEAVKPKKKLLLMPAEETSSVQEESPVLVKSTHIDEDEETEDEETEDEETENEDTEDEDDLSNDTVSEERRTSFLNKWRSQMEKMQADMKERIRNKMEVQSKSGGQSVDVSSSEYETADDADADMAESQLQKYDQVDATTELESCDENETTGE